MSGSCRMYRVLIMIGGSPPLSREEGIFYFPFTFHHAKVRGYALSNHERVRLRSYFIVHSVGSFRCFDF